MYMAYCMVCSCISGLGWDFTAKGRVLMELETDERTRALEVVKGTRYRTEAPLEGIKQLNSSINKRSPPTFKMEKKKKRRRILEGAGLERSGRGSRQQS